jgi:AcrR family transcriptional regulator
MSRPRRRATSRRSPMPDTAADPTSDADLPNSGGTRRYDGSGRQRDAAERRRRVLEAAHALFLEHGFGGTSIEQIATQAGTSAQTVYAAFGTKAGVLRRVIDVAIAGDEDDAKVFDRPRAVAIVEEPDLTSRMQLIARFAADAHRRSGKLVCLVERVAGAEPALAELAADLRHQLRADAQRLVDAIPTARRRTGLTTDQLVDLALLLGEARTWFALVVERSWTDEQYIDWFADAMGRNLLREHEPHAPHDGHHSGGRADQPGTGGRGASCP